LAEDGPQPNNELKQGMAEQGPKPAKAPPAPPAAPGPAAAGTMSKA